ncbi:MAG: Signal recognition particle 54 kDa protein, partial [Pseudomonadota bacterium]
MKTTSAKLEDNKRQARERQATQVTKPIIQVNAKAAPVKAKVTAKPSAKAQASEAEQEIRDHEMVRGREIIELVREELASLRREFKLSQQMATWQGTMPLPPALTPMRDALNDAPIPVALRALLIDSIKDHDNMADAKLALHNQLAHAVEQEQLAM